MAGEGEIDVDVGAWVGRSDLSHDVAAAQPVQRLSAVLDHGEAPWRAGVVPPLGHWLYFLPDARQSGLDADGHPRRGGFLPPVALPRRMWAGGRLAFHAPIPLGAALERRSTILSVAPKTGRSGAMVFVTVRHAVFADGVLALTEEQDIVYREAASTPGTAAVVALPPATTPPEWTRRVVPDPVLLFRYSALTFNAHRIHYDPAFCREVEGYPGLVVQGPLIATLLMDHYLRRRPEARILRFDFRAHGPLFDTAPFILNGCEADAGAALWATDEAGGLAMQANLVVGADPPRVGALR
jgi:3-methylfumaryl-CoA hydratase